MLHWLQISKRLSLTKKQRALTGWFHQPNCRSGSVKSGIKNRDLPVFQSCCKLPAVTHRGGFNWPDTVKWPVILPVTGRQVLRLCFIALWRWILCKNYPPDWWLDTSQRRGLSMDTPVIFTRKKRSHVPFQLFSLFITNYVNFWEVCFYSDVN